MSAEVMFATSYEQLVKDIRMSVTKNEHSKTAVDRALEESQTTIIAILGIDRVKEIRAITWPTDKFTEDYQTKKAAAQLETLNTELLLITDLPVSVTGQSQAISPEQQFEEEVLIREAEQDNLEIRKEELRCRVADLLVKVSAIKSAPCVQAHITPVAPIECKYVPGQTVFGTQTLW